MDIKSVTLPSTGVQMWLLQRVTAVYIAVYAVVFLTYWLFTPLDYISWSKFFACRITRYASFLLVLSVNIHSWIGLWTVATDYMKSSFIRVGFMSLLLIYLLGLQLYSIDIFWGASRGL